VLLLLMTLKIALVHLSRQILAHDPCSMVMPNDDRETSK
jgi:hypothetical protein